MAQTCCYLDLLLLLDLALEMIHADRESLKRVETFAGYPGHYGHRVHATIEEIFILLYSNLILPTPRIPTLSPPSSPAQPPSVNNKIHNLSKHPRSPVAADRHCKHPTSRTSPQTN